VKTEKKSKILSRMQLVSGILGVVLLFISLCMVSHYEVATYLAVEAAGGFFLILFVALTANS